MEVLTYYPVLGSQHGIVLRTFFCVNTGSVIVFLIQVQWVTCGDKQNYVIQGSEPFQRVTSRTIAPELYVFHSLLDSRLLVSSCICTHPPCHSFYGVASCGQLSVVSSCLPFLLSWICVRVCVSVYVRVCVYLVILREI